jgi:hypothetical protein
MFVRQLQRRENVLILPSDDENVVVRGECLIRIRGAEA